MRFQLLELRQCVETELPAQEFATRLRERLAKVVALTDSLQDLAMNSEPLQAKPDANEGGAESDLHLRNQLAELKVRLELRDMETQKLREDLEQHKKRSKAAISVLFLQIYPLIDRASTTAYTR